MTEVLDVVVTAAWVLAVYLGAGLTVALLFNWDDPDPPWFALVFLAFCLLC